jgi:homoserine/homoserine lactone efflux protein
MPVDLATLGAFAVAAAAIAVSPGPDTMLILRYALTSGRRAGFAAVLGVQIGLLVHTALAAAGVSAVIASSPLLFEGLAMAGAGYLAWLGIQGLRGTGALSMGGGALAARAGRACRDAMLCNLLNPKVIVLFLALYPNFLVVGRGAVAAQVATLSAVLIAINVAWQVSLAWSADAARRWLTRPATQRVVARTTGAILLVFAALMLWEHVV